MSLEAASDDDWRVRLAAFAALGRLARLYGAVLPWAIIDEGFVLDGRRFRFANQSKGIFRPAGMVDAALSLKTAVPKAGTPRYDDLQTDDAFVYAFQRRGPDYHDNRLLLRAIELRAPLIYFYGIEPGLYRALWPTYASQRSAENVSLSVEPAEELVAPGYEVADAAMRLVVRRYSTVEARKRLHQDVFRARVLKAYVERCAVCQLPRRELLDAAHILPDRLELGLPVVSNGLALCKLHHAAYDAHLIGIRPDCVVEISSTLMRERDSPILECGLKSFHGRSIGVPRKIEQRPAAASLEGRYEMFRMANPSI